MWEDFKYDIFVINHESENAFALLWWKIAITDKLIENIKYENSLLFIIWHEVAHIENRDVFKSLVSTVPVQIILSIIWIWWDIDLSFLLSWTNDIYSKWVESNADVVWIDFVNNLKWEVSCITYFFEKQLSFWNDFATFLSDHPMDSSRISKIKSIVKKKWYKNEEECELLNF